MENNKEFNLDFNKKLIILTGENGTGKSTILNSLCLSKHTKYIELPNLVINKQQWYGKIVENKQFKEVIDLLYDMCNINNLQHVYFNDTFWFYYVEYGKDKQSIDLNSAPMSVKILAGFIIALNTGKITKHTKLAIDNIEMGLDLKNQVLMARVIGLLINKGVKIALSTHSDFFVKEINNLIMISNGFKDKTKILSRYGYTGKESLKSKDIQVLEFFRNKDIKEVKATDHDSEYKVDLFQNTLGNLDSRGDNLNYYVRESKVDKKSGVGIETMNIAIEHIETTVEDLYIRTNSKDF